MYREMSTLWESEETLLPKIKDYDESVGITGCDL